MPKPAHIRTHSHALSSSLVAIRLSPTTQATKRSTPTDHPRPPKLHDPTPTRSPRTRVQGPKARRSHRHAPHSASTRSGPRPRRPNPGISHPLRALLLLPALRETTPLSQIRFQPCLAVSVLAQPRRAPTLVFAVQFVEPRVYRQGPGLVSGQLDCETERLSVLYRVG
jgi:hypothetical protein